MKTRTTLLATLLALTFASCGEMTDTPDGGDKPITIGFTAHETHVTDTSTRGEIIGNTGDLQSPGYDGFDAWTYVHTGPSWTSIDLAFGSIGGGVKVTWDGSGWNYGIPILWPTDENVTSFAIAPHAASAGGYTVTHRDGDVPLVAYTLPVPGAAQHDLLFAETKSYTPATAPSNGVIPKIFHHALSQLSFKAFKMSRLMNVFVTGITLSGIYDSGTAPLTGENISWTPTGSPAASYGFTATGGLTGSEITATATDAPQGLLSADVGTLFMLPQTLDDTAQIVVEYTIDGQPKSTTMSLHDITAGHEWIAGKPYSITIGIYETFTEPFTETYEAWPVPAKGYYYIETWGGNGGAGNGGGQYQQAGAGGTAVLQPGLFYFNGAENLYIQVGTAGVVGSTNSDITGGGGGIGGVGQWFGSGGTGGSGGDGRDPLVGSNIGGGGGGGGGGAASGVLLGGTTTGNIIVASGGGGGGGGNGDNDTGGDGGNSGSSGYNATPGPGDGGAGGGTVQDPDGPNNTHLGRNGSSGGPGNATNTLLYKYRGGGGGGAGGGGWDGIFGGGQHGHGGTPNSRGSNSGGGGAGGASYTAPSGQSIPANIAAIIDDLKIDGYPGTDVRSNGPNGFVRITYLGPALP